MKHDEYNYLKLLIVVCTMSLTFIILILTVCVLSIIKALELIIIN